jgi:small-conductance mechanosensitive channel
MIDYILRHWQSLLPPAIVFAAVFVTGWFLRLLLFRLLSRWARNTPTKWDDLAIAVLRRPSLLWLAILGLHLAAESSALPRNAAALVSKTLLILWILSLTMAAAKLATGLVRQYGSRSAALPVTTLTQNLARLVVGSIGVLILLNTLGVSVTPILTMLGVGGLAVALALQDTLSNLFAGFYVSVEGRERVGDYIKLNTGEEGYVADIGWRSTTLRALANNLIVIPNAKLAQAIVTNFHLPEKRMSLSIPIGVSYDCDPELVENVLVEETLSAAQAIPGLLTEPAPLVRLIPGFGEFSLNFTLTCHVAEFVDQYLVQHELRKRILRRFRKEGIEIPFPIRTIRIGDKPQAGIERSGIELNPKDETQS